MVMPSAASLRMTSSTSPTISGSSAEVGSSNSMICGFMHRARAMATRCFWPPDRRPTAACANFSSPTLVRCSIATFSASALLIFLSVTGASVQLSSTSMLLNRLKPWNTMPMSSRSLLMLQRSAVRSWPWNQMWPASGVSSRLRQRRKVDLPEPEAPMMVTTSPGLTARSIPLSTSSEPKLLRKPSTRMSGSLVCAAAAAPVVAVSAMMILLVLSLVGAGQRCRGLGAELFAKGLE